ncbi:hypothetical protein [Saliphagus infecundisoli]|uniref:Uncharacterized protein n=1 Tax=Saliphagus infecundisoli TaxID=1849069 RepID=A0ABD5QBN0_9EURY|nr:hypothetical protein [Saliphagus infecundisoli]
MIETLRETFDVVLLGITILMVAFVAAFLNGAVEIGTGAAISIAATLFAVWVAYFQSLQNYKQAKDQHDDLAESQREMIERYDEELQLLREQIKESRKARLESHFTERVEIIEETISVLDTHWESLEDPDGIILKEPVFDEDSVETIHLEYFKEEHPDLFEELDEYYDKRQKYHNGIIDVRDKLRPHVEIYLSNSKDERTDDGEAITEFLLFGAAPPPNWIRENLDVNHDTFDLREDIARSGDFDSAHTGIFLNEHPSWWMGFVETQKEFRSKHKHLERKLDDVKTELKRQGV